ncbi:FecR family protein [Stenotrophomonas humi]|uniref:FecR family protein n=1 Tax=Stenotrophomonas humi TaxID=405444 RepID=UPI0007102BBA|nr:FecR domain-containing protein [Stenotrophomonas humi]
MPDRFRSRNTAIDDEAIAWLACMGGNPSTAEQDAFAQWCARSPAHGRALHEAQVLLEAVGHTDAAHEHRQLVQVLAVPAAPGISRRGLLLGAASAAALTGIGVLGMSTALLADEHTATGERRALVLPDGSRAWLNTASALSLDFSRQQRLLALKAGEIFVDVVAGDLSAIRVTARDGQLSTRAARFSLRQEGRRSVLTVLSGVVELSNVAGASTITADQRLIFNGDVIGLVEAVDAAALTAWTRGKLIFNQQPLQEIARELERYQHGRVRVVGERLQQLRLSGVFALDDLDALLLAVASLAGAELVRLPLLSLIR